MTWEVMCERQNAAMPTLLDLSTWPRRSAFEYFRDFDKPWFSVCTRVDVAPLARLVAGIGSASLALAWHHLVLRLVNRVEPFRYRLQGGQVWVHEEVHGSTTVLRDDGSFGFATLEMRPDFAGFASGAGAAIAAARDSQRPFEPGGEERALVYFTSLPWVHFTSFSHARRHGREDSIPRFAFGRIADEGAQRWLPVSIDVHHALMDGVHVGDFVQRFEAALAAPQDWL